MGSFSKWRIKLLSTITIFIHLYQSWFEAKLVNVVRTSMTSYSVFIPNCTNLQKRPSNCIQVLLPIPSGDYISSLKWKQSQKENIEAGGNRCWNAGRRKAPFCDYPLDLFVKRCWSPQTECLHLTKYTLYKRWIIVEQDLPILIL